jgi:hypothetical protein
VVASLPYNKLGKLPFNNLIKMIDGASLDIWLKCSQYAYV